MSTQALQKKPETESILSMMAADYHLDRVALAETLKKTIFPGGTATNEQLAAFVAVAHQYRLNPFLKEIYAFPAKGGGVIPIVSIDGWLKIINRHQQLEWISTQDTQDEHGKPYACTATIQRKDRPSPTVVTEYLAECKRNTDPWNQMPSRMLRHRAIIQCARVAFGFSGIQEEDEARDAVQCEEAQARPAIPTVTRRQVAPAPQPETEPYQTAESHSAPVNLDTDEPPAPNGLPLNFDSNREVF